MLLSQSAFLVVGPSVLREDVDQVSHIGELEHLAVGEGKHTSCGLLFVCTREDLNVQ